MHAHRHRQPAGHDAELFTQQRPGQGHALAGGEHAAVRSVHPIDPSGSLEPARSSVIGLDMARY
jgi:hypothetical protein